MPTLVIHGDADAIVPFEKSGQRTHEQVAGSELHVVAGGPHGINTSHAEEFNAALLASSPVTGRLPHAPPAPDGQAVAAGGSDAGGAAVDAGLLALLRGDRGRGVGQRVVAAAATSGTR